MFFAKVDGMEFRSQGADFGDSGPYELFLNTLVERAMERYDASCGDPYHFAASWISDQALGVDIEAINEIEDEIVVDGLGPVKKAMAPEAKSIQVGGYTKKDGTVVKPYSRDGDKKAEESSSPKSKKEEKPSVLHSRRDGETDLDYLARVYEAASGKLGAKRTEEFYESLDPSVSRSDSDAAMHLQVHVLRHSLQKLLPTAEPAYLVDFLDSLLDSSSDSRERKAVDHIGGLDEFVKAASQLPYGLQHAVRYNTERIQAGDPIGFGGRRDIHYALHLKAFLDYAADPMAIRNALSDVIKSGDHPQSLTESLQSVAKQFWMVTNEGTRKQEMLFAIEENIHEFKMGELYYLKEMLDSSDVNVSLLADLVDSRMGDLVPALMHNEFEGELIDPDDALSDLDALLEHTDGFPLFHTKVMDRYEYWENEKIKLEKQARAKQVREMVLANANVNREQQAANDAVLKSQYAEVEGRLKEIAGGVKSPASFLSGGDDEDVQTAVRLFSLMPDKEHWRSFEATHVSDSIMSDLVSRWIEAAEWEEVNGNPTPERDIEILRSLAVSPQETRLLLKKYNDRYKAVMYTVRSVKRNNLEGNSNQLNSLILKRFLKNGGSEVSVDDLLESIQKEPDENRLMNQDSLAESLIVGNLVDLEKGLAFKNPDGEIDQSSLELFKGTTSDKAYADAQAIAKKIQSTRQQEIFKERLEAGLLSERTASRSADNESLLKGIAADVWSGWKSSSTTATGKAMQLAAVEEFGVLGKPEYEIDREAIIAGVGEEMYDLIKVHLRATWEATQYLLKATGKDNVVMWRGLQLPASDLGLSDEMKAAPRLKKFKLDNLKLLRNGLSSATTDPKVANSWGGVGELPKDARRVVIRIDAGAEDILSLPVFGDNVHSEQEVLPMGSRWNRWDAWLNVAPDSPETDWTPEPNESKSMITEIDGERIIEFDGGGGWLEGYGEIDNELEVIGDEAFELAAEEGNEEVASVLKSIGQAMLEFTDRKGYVKPYTKADGTRVAGYHTGRSKKQDAPASARPQGSSQATSPRPSSGAGFSLDKVGDPMPKEIEVNGSDRSTFPAIKKIVAQDLGFPKDLSTVIKAAGVTETAETKVSLHPPGNNWTDNGSSVVLVVSKDGFKNIRAFYKDDDGNLVLKNESFKVYDKGKGLGTKMLARQIKHCKDIGVTKMTCDAIRVDGYEVDGKTSYDAGYSGNSQRVNGGMASGYYVWPLMGYDAEIDWGKHRDAFWDEEYDTGDYDTHDDLMSDAPESVRKSKRLSAIMRTDEGRKWWSKYGVGMEMEFDLTEGSQSMRIFNEYLKRKGMS
jgi:hypothetical protein